LQFTFFKSQASSQPTKISKPHVKSSQSPQQKSNTDGLKRRVRLSTKDFAEECKESSDIDIEEEMQNKLKIL
jgi:hypothetical protein